MTSKEGQKEGRLRRYVFTCKARDLTSKLKEAILKRKDDKSIKRLSLT